MGGTSGGGRRYRSTLSRSGSPPSWHRGALTRRAGAAAAAGECRHACGLYERSLGQWRGEVLADVDLLQAHPVVAEVTCRHGHAMLRFALAAAAAGRHERVLPHLRRLCEHEPFNEQAHAGLIELAAAGQRAAVRRLFGQLKGCRETELDICPGPEVAAAHLRILRQQA
jgi:hypothetical protein